ncbi:amino acid adenylation domain-containing protein [Micromonospora sp. NPDC050417]|uniref:amino acid adenylation domain-containing protein n=1 Tax=Micromonospora sp. NPDC050417 TaxID=3364280 RepID=UPI0037BD71DE
MTNSPNHHPTLPVTLLDLLARSVARFPDRPAVSDDRQSLTYTELDRRSSTLAALLRQRGVGEEDRAALYLDRSVDVFVAILGILKAGACYVAVDTRYPDARRDEMISGSGSRVVITRPEWEPHLAHLDVTVLAYAGGTVDVPADGTGDGAARDLGSTIRPEQAATVLFTSGSSGTPKAIVLEHRNIVSFACNPDLPGLTPQDRVGQISSLSFDAFHFEMWSTLAYGAEVTVLPPVPELLAADFQREMRRRQITAMLVPTMVINHAVREDRDAFASLRLLQAGGDVLLPSSCRALLGGAFTGELWNLYGPAEITTACTAQRVTAAEAALDNVPIGRPLAGTTVYVLDEQREPVRPGDVGELYVGGPGLARGYLGRADLTGERFVPSPFPGGPSRLYRTGDLAREGADGILEFVGRADSQVKIRGYRVEPGEVERALCRHPDVPDAVVVPSGTGDDRHLLAFVVLDGDLTPAGLRQYARDTLPDFMVPGHFLVLPQIPANEHGKRDQEGLRELVAQHQLRQESYIAPRTATERHLAGLWEELLSAERVGANDDFFALGGHSLLAFRLHRQIRRGLGVDLEHGAVLRNTVLADLATAIDETADRGVLI